MSKEQLAETFRWYAVATEALGSPMWGVANRRFADDVEAGGPTWGLLEPHAAESTDAAFPLRMLGGAHRLALDGDAPALAAHLPSTGGDGDVEGAWRALHELVAAPPPALRDALTRPPQTNEVGRSASLVGGFLLVAEQLHHPLRVCEIGTSAGLNLRFDQFRYEQGDAAFGPADSPVRFEGLWQPDDLPPFDAPLEVVERAGCDVDPIDPTTPDGRLTLLSYVWPDQDERFARTAGAIDVASRVPAAIERETAPVWLERQLTELPEGTTTVVFHSIMWQYLDDETRTEVRRVLEHAGSRATEDAPLAWLRLEPDVESSCAELRLTTWREEHGSIERLLARCSFHTGPVDWLTDLD